MPLAAGSRVGEYEVLGPLGAGGMGEVYRARDEKLNRDVAIKVLPDLFTSDPDRLARFRREAQVLASLNHPNIGHIYGIEDSASAGVHALVLELIEGPTLQDRIEQGPVPLDEAIPIARQMADALECAHELGVIHRDLKPANVKIRPDGMVKVLDFGLAKAFDPGSASSSEMMNSPTLTARATMMGVVLGTAAYMAPEQARGRIVDRRADIWAFGVVLFEMLTGKRAFEGDDISITLASVLKDEVDWKSLPGELPRPIRRLLRRCLEKDPKKRLSAIGDARLELEEAIASPADEPVATTTVIAPAVPGWRRVLPWTSAAGAATFGIAMLMLWAPWRAPQHLSPVRLSAEPGIDAPAALALSPAPAVAISRDGQTVAFIASAGSRGNLIYVRRLNQLRATPLAGTEGAYSPFFKPDGEWIGFFAAGKLRKIAVAGGAAVTLCDAPNARGGSWGEDGAIIFTPDNAAYITLRSVPEAGGPSVPFGALAPGELTQRWPQVLPGGRFVLYSGGASAADWDSGTVMIEPRGGGSATTVIRGGFHGRYIPTGHLVYVNQGTLFAVAFDLATLKTVGAPAPVLEGVVSSTITGAAHYSVADNGTIVYISGSSASRTAPIQIMDAAGKTTALRAEPADWFYPAFSPDGRKLAMSIAGGSGIDIWIHEEARDLTKFTFEPGIDTAPVWTPDGRRIAFLSTRAGTGSGNLYWQRSDGTGDVQRLTEGLVVQTPYSFDPSGKYLAFSERVAGAPADIKILPLEGDEKSGWKSGKPTTFLATPATETSPMFSPDGRWIAYMSNESGQMEVYVRPSQGTEGKWKISTATGLYPVWSKKKNDLFYLTNLVPSQLMAVTYTVEGDSFRAEKPRPWSQSGIQPHGPERPYDMHPDGQHIVMVKPPDRTDQERDRAVFIFNFFDELRRVAPVK